MEQGVSPAQRWRRRESKPEERSGEPVRTVATRRETHMSTGTARDETRRAIAKAPTPRASLVADLADHVRELAFVDERERAGVMTALAPSNPPLYQPQSSFYCVSQVRDAGAHVTGKSDRR